MEINTMREIIADKLASSETDLIWQQVLDDTSPANYGIEDIYVSVASSDIWVDVPKRTFTFKDTSISFSARLGGSSDKDGYDEDFDFNVSGSGFFDFSDGGSSIIVKDFTIKEYLDLYGD